MIRQSLMFPLSCLVAGSWRAVKAKDPGNILQAECVATNSSRVWQLERFDTHHGPGSRLLFSGLVAVGGIPIQRSLATRRP